MQNEPFLRRIKIRNYKSIGKSDVKLGRLNVLVGRNGSGKSNFLDALRFVVDGLQTSLDHAIKARGGIDEVRRRSTGHPHNFGVEVEMNLPDWNVASYGFEISSQPKGGFLVKSEKLDLRGPQHRSLARFRVLNGEIKESSVENMPKTASDRLYLVTASGLPQFESVYDGLLAMGFYNLSPEQMKEVQGPDAGELLRRDGSNIASVVARLTEDEPLLKKRVKDYLAAIVPDIVDFERVPLGHRETLQFRQQVKGSKHPWRFYAANMSDGTLRTLGILVAAMQLANRKSPVRLVGIEEPETALHPAAAGALMDSLREAATNTQVLLTSHSPDLLDRFDPDVDTLLVVQANQGATEIGPADPASLESIRSHLYSAGDLLRMDQLRPDPEALEKQMELVFETGMDES
jgi:predicted ATPase